MPRLVLALALLLGGCTGLSRLAPPAFEAHAGARAGRVSGFVQTPKGGAPGTTSLRRPRLGELGVKSAVQPLAELVARCGPHEGHLGGAWLLLHGDAVLAEDLVTHGDPYPAGTRVESASGIGTAWLGYRHAFEWGLPDGGSLRAAPGLALFAYRQDYRVEGSNGEEGRRAFGSPSPAFDGTLVWRPGRSRMRLEGGLRLVADEALGLSSPTLHVDARLRLHLDAWRHAGLWLETGWWKLEHHDEQPVPNDLGVDFAPFVGLGATLRF